MTDIVMSPGLIRDSWDHRIRCLLSEGSWPAAEEGVVGATISLDE